MKEVLHACIQETLPEPGHTVWIKYDFNPKLISFYLSWNQAEVLWLFDVPFEGLLYFINRLNDLVLAG